MISIPPWLEAEMLALVDVLPVPNPSLYIFLAQVKYSNGVVSFSKQV